MSKLVTIFEVDYHAEVLRNLLMVLLETDYDVQLVTKKKVWIDLALTCDKIIVIFLDDYSGMTHLLQKQSERINASEVIIFNTTSSHYKSYAQFEFVPRLIVRVHNVNTCFRPLLQSYKPIFTPFYLFKDISHFIRRELIHRDYKWRKKFLSNVDFFSFFSKQMEVYALQSKYVTEERVLRPAIPSVFYLNFPVTNNEQEKIRITIVGTIDKRRRNYEEVLEAFQSISKSTRRKMELCLLGRPYGGYGRGMQKRFKALENELFAVTVFDGFIDQNKFQNQILQSDLLLCPIHENVRHTVYGERYGQTKISGAVNDSISFGIPCLFPDFYKSPEGMEKYFYTYDRKSQGLKEALTEFLKREDVKLSKQNYFRTFSLQRAAMELENSVLNAVNK